MIAAGITINFPGDIPPEYAPATNIPRRFLPLLPGLPIQGFQLAETSFMLQTLQGAGVSWNYLQAEVSSPQTLFIRAHRPVLLFVFGITGAAGLQFRASEKAVTIHAQEQAGFALRKGPCRLQLDKGVQRFHLVSIAGPYAAHLSEEFSRFQQLYRFLSEGEGARQLPVCLFQQEATVIFNRLQNTAREHVPLLLYYKENIYKLLKAYHQRLMKLDDDPGRQTVYDQALRYAREHLLEPDLDPDRVAKGIGVTRRTLNHAFENRIIKISRFIKILRLLKAQEMLCFTDIPVDEIAAIVGYDSSSYFNKCFAKRFSMTPQEYRNSMR